MSKKSSRSKKASPKNGSVKVNVETTPATDHSPYVFQRDKIAYDLIIKELPWTDKQKEIIKLFLDKNCKVLFLKGVAGSSKTLLSMYLGLQLLNARKVSDMVLIRSAVESSDSKLGFLPGDLVDKFGVYLTPFNEKFSELLAKPFIDKLEKDNRLTMCPVNFARGLHFSAKFVCCDEAQNLSRKELLTVLTRLGMFTKTIICGDPDQSDLPPGKSGFKETYDLFNCEEAREMGVYCVELTEIDVVRSELCKFVVKKFKELAPIVHHK